MAKHEARDEENSVWLVDSGYSNHMTSQRSLFRELDETQKQSVKLGYNKEPKVKGQETIAIKTQQGEVKLLHNVQFVPNLAHNLIGVGQLLTNGYSINFDDTMGSIIDKKIGKQVASIKL